MAQFRVTYATLSADNDELHDEYAAESERQRAALGAEHPMRIGHEQRLGDSFETVSPVDTSVVVGRFPQAGTADVDDAVSAAHHARADWAATPWQQRCDILDRAADLISERSIAQGAALSWENGKNRLEAIGEVEETADLIRYCTHAMREHEGFAVPMERFHEHEVTSDVMRPYGVWAVIGPFNYPNALIGGPTGAALTAGNTVVIKPSPVGSLSAHLVFDALVDGGVPAGVVNLVTGDANVGAQLVEHPDVAGVTFTGSSTVGQQIMQACLAPYARPAICEMGGKNPVIVTASADLELAVEGTARSAFGFAGQKCSAASRVLVDQTVAEEFIERLVARAGEISTASPLERDGFLSPVIDDRALERFAAAVGSARDAGEVLAGGERLTDGHRAAGNYVAPTVVTTPVDADVATDELFLPFVTVGTVASLDEALEVANRLPYGLTAGLFASDDAEIERFFDTIEAGVVYVNRPAGATTGAWPGVQPFGGWKASGSTGALGGGPYYLQQYLREQSRTNVLHDR